MESMRGVEVAESGAWDEVKDFIDTRYVGPAEAAWRILEFPLHGISHAVEALPVHVQGEQTVCLPKADAKDADALQEKAEKQKSEANRVSKEQQAQRPFGTPGRITCPVGTHSTGTSAEWRTVGPRGGIPNTFLYFGLAGSGMRSCAPIKRIDAISRVDDC